MSVSDEQMRQAQRDMAARHAFGVARGRGDLRALPGLLASGALDGSERIVLFATANGAK